MHLPTSPPPQYLHFAEALEIASMLARGYGHGQESGIFSGYGYLLNMEKLFETFIEKSLKNAVNLLQGGAYHIEPQDTILFATPVNHYGRSYYTRPDNVLYIEGKPILVIDAKYKTLTDAEEGPLKKPRNSDIYQLFASTLSHKCDRGLLIYPKTLNDDALPGGKIRYWSHKVNENNILMGAVAVDISGLYSKKELNDFDLHLTSLLKDFLRV